MLFYEMLRCELCRDVPAARCAVLAATAIATLQRFSFSTRWAGGRTGSVTGNNPRRIDGRHSSPHFKNGMSTKHEKYLYGAKCEAREDEASLRLTQFQRRFHRRPTTGLYPSSTACRAHPDVFLSSDARCPKKIFGAREKVGPGAL